MTGRPPGGAVGPQAGEPNMTGPDGVLTHVIHMTEAHAGRRGISTTVRKLLVPAATAAQQRLADRGALLIGVFFYLIVSVVLSALWRAAAEHGPVAGYSAQALTWYVFTAEAAVCAIEIRLIERIGDDIGSGAVTIEMLRPTPVATVRFAFEFGRALVNRPICALRIAAT